MVDWPMSLPAYAAPLQIELAPSRWLALLLLLLSLLLTLTLLLILPRWLLPLALLLPTFCFWWAATIHAGLELPAPAWLRRRRIVALLWDSEGCWTLQCADGERHPARLARDFFVTPQLGVLCFGRRSAVLLRERVGEVCWRRLRVRLRLEGGA